MDGVLDGESPRRGSLSSLHRQSSGSFSHGCKLSSPASGIQTNQNATSNLYKDLDKFTRYFIIKTVQVIVQSRIGGSKKVKTECKPTGNDWFNINISDIAEVSDQTKAALGCDGFSVRTNWHVCCEISLRTSDGGRIILEHWIISNKAYPASNQSHLSSRLNANQAASKVNQSSNRSPHLSNSTNGAGPLIPINSPPTTRVGPIFSNKLRSRLNSIDDFSGDINFSANKLLIGTNNENIDLKPSTSCFSLSSAPANQAADSANTIAASPSINSLSNNPTQGQPTNSTTNNSSSSQQSYKTSAMSSIYTIYNRMSLLLKTLMTTTHIVPAYRLATKTIPTDPCTICYRIYTNSSSYQNPKATKGSIEDISTMSESPNKRSSFSNSSSGSLNIREFVSPDELDHFCPMLKLGSIKTDVNELDISLCYRTDMKNSNRMMRSPRSRCAYSKILDEDCITAAKQLLAGNEYVNQSGQVEDDFESCSDEEQQRRELYNNDALSYIDQPLRPAFASKEQKADKLEQDPSLEIIEPAFDDLLQINNNPPSEDSICINPDSISKPSRNLSKDSPNVSGTPTNAQSDPIQVPTKSRHVELCQNLSPGSTPKSLTDSFVFVDLNPPFASEEQNDINSFFHGLSPAFNNGFDSLGDIDELSNQLAVIEANANQIDEFVDNICISEDEDE